MLPCSSHVSRSALLKRACNTAFVREPCFANASSTAEDGPDGIGGTDGNGEDDDAPPYAADGTAAAGSCSSLFLPFFFFLSDDLPPSLPPPLPRSTLFKNSGDGS